MSQNSKVLNKYRYNQIIFKYVCRNFILHYRISSVLYLINIFFISHKNMLPYPVHLPMLRSNVPLAKNQQEDSPIDSRFTEIPVKDITRKQQYMAKSFETQTEFQSKLNKSPERYTRDNDYELQAGERILQRQRKYASETKMKASPINIISNSKPKTRKTTSVRPCGNERCTICNKIKPKKQKSHLNYLSRIKNKAPIPYFPQINPSKPPKNKYSRIRINTQPEEDYFKNGRYKQVRSRNQQKDRNIYIIKQLDSINPAHRRINSVLERSQEPNIRQMLRRQSQIRKSEKYSNDSPPIYKEDFYNKQFLKYGRNKYYTESEETEQKKYRPRILKINGKLYQIVSQEMMGSADKRNENMEEIMPRSFQQRRYEQQKNVQRANWQKKRQKENKEREQLNKSVEEFIQYETMFYFYHKQGEANSHNIKFMNKIESSRYTVKSARQYEDDPYKKYYTNKRQILINQINQEEPNEVYNIKFPSLSEIQDRINNYQSLTGQIDINVLKNMKDFTRQYSSQEGKEFLYFGSVDQRTKERKGLGVLVTKKIIFQGIWLKGFILRGAQLRANSIYKGEFQKNKKSGQGTCKWLNGQQYMGQWQNGLRNGHGFWSSKAEVETYSGEWKNGKVFGYGQYFKQNYSIYKGNFQDFIKHGKGVQQFQNGDKFQGVYENGFPQGFGTYIWKCGLKFQGQFKKGLRIGKGVLSKQNLFQIQGKFENEKPHGICQLRLQNKDVFNGKYVFGKKYGFGKLQYNGSNRIEEGFWNNGKLKEKIDEMQYDD